MNGSVGEGDGLEAGGSTGERELLVVIVNYRTAGLTIDCLASLEREVGSLAGVRVRVVVTDNASGDDSVARLEGVVRERGWGSWATVWALERNGGFAYGNNAAIRPALERVNPPEYVWLLNPDTVVRPGALEALWRFMGARPDVGITGSRLEDPDGTVQRSAFRFPTVLGEFESGARLGVVTRLLERWVVAPPASETPCVTDWVAGASMLIRREVLESIGLFDEDYFMYFEEVDFCARARKAGWPCWYVPGSRVVHLVGQSSGVTDTRKPQKRRPGYWFQARRRYFRRNLGWPRAVAADLAFAVGFGSYRIRQRLQGKADVDPGHLLRDFIYQNFIAGHRS